MEYDIILGLEIHAELKTKSKMFCPCDNDSLNKPANSVVCPICLGHPGTLPLPNKQAIEWTILIGLATNCQINHLTKFDRKHYFYPDLPKGYQISQYDLPISYGGFLEINQIKIPITRIHLEEDTGKLTHPAGKNYTLADFNRAGTPLIEMVTEPVIPDALTAKKFCQRYQQILRYLNISDAEMEKGQMRCEANISLQEKGRWIYKGDCKIEPLGDYKLNPKVEVKNINSFRALEKAINYEVMRQSEALKNNEPLFQETRGWNEDRGATISQRVKETAADYRYFFEPDIPPLRIDPQWIEKIKQSLHELPTEKIKRFKEEYGLNDEVVEILVSEKTLANYAEAVFSELIAWLKTTNRDESQEIKKAIKLASNWLTSELFKHLKTSDQNISNIKITPENFAELITLLHENKINSSAGQTILEKMYQIGGDPSNLMKELGLEQLDNREELEKTVKSVLDKNPTQVEQYRSGKTNVLQFLVGQVMTITKGKANPKIVSEILMEELK